MLRSGKGADLLMVDVAIDIRELVKRLDAEHIHAPIVACGVTNDARAAVDAIHAGAKEYIPLPPDAELIAAVLAAVADDSREMIWRDAAMEQVVKLAQQIAGSEASILITGESGIGKEVLARYVHTRSQRAKKPFICGQLRAPFPRTCWSPSCSATRRAPSPARWRAASASSRKPTAARCCLTKSRKWTCGCRPSCCAPSRSGVIDRVGGTKPVPVDIRIIATSNRNLVEAVRDGTFREDLLFRLNVVNLSIPPLRERPADIVELAGYFVKKYAEANGVPLRPLSREAERALAPIAGRATCASWKTPCTAPCCSPPAPRSASRHSGAGRQPARPGPWHGSRRAHAAMAAEQVTRNLVGRTVAEVERDLILETLTHCLGNRTHAANILGISIRTLRNKLNEYAVGRRANPACRRWRAARRGLSSASTEPFGTRLTKPPLSAA